MSCLGIEGTTLRKVQSFISRDGARFTHFVKHDCIKDGITRAYDRFVKKFSVNTVCLQMITFCPYTHFTQRPNFLGCKRTHLDICTCDVEASKDLYKWLVYTRAHVRTLSFSAVLLF